ncbi:hypothetical protein [Bacillus thuringiensis]|uniref:hypothetical protein n=1 Tax=Bacillus thuringiensis TaxID=1428 RepID=UPI002156687F|nr:hypothetical protein [Bacillus thuringiensis]
MASLEALPAEDQKMRLQYWKEHFSSKEILEGLGTYKRKLYDLYKRHEITTQGTVNLKRKGKEMTNILIPPNQLKRKHLYQQFRCKMYP